MLPFFYLAFFLVTIIRIHLVFSLPFESLGECACLLPWVYPIVPPVRGKIVFHRVISSSTYFKHHIIASIVLKTCLIKQVFWTYYFYCSMLLARVNGENWYQFLAGKKLHWQGKHLRKSNLKPSAGATSILFLDLCRLTVWRCDI